MNGQRRGPMAAMVRMGMSIASFPYGIAVARRNRSFDREQGVQHCGVPVVSVGNLTTGGTGKTPVVAFLAKRFRERGIRVAIVSRGYGRGQSDQNDEAAELNQRLPDVPHVQDPDRVKAARIAVDELETQLILMDDGFQHRRLHRDLNIVLIDMTCPFGFGHLLPRGLLREPVKNIRRADVAILTRCDQVPQTEIDAVIAKIRSCHPLIIVLRSTHRPSGLLQYPGKRLPIETLLGQRVALVSGIGNPNAFRRSVTDIGANVIDQRIFADHAPFDRAQMEALMHWAAEQRSMPQGAAQWLVCTQKDLVKLMTDRIGGLPLVALTIDAEIESNTPPSDQFNKLLDKIIQSCQPLDDQPLDD